MLCVVFDVGVIVLLWGLLFCCGVIVLLWGYCFIVGVIVLLWGLLFYCGGYCFVVGVIVWFMLIVFIYTYWSSTDNPSVALVFSRVHVALSLVFCVLFCRSLFVLWLLNCLSYDLQLLITP